MRIVAGEWGGRPLRGPKNDATRPTSDRLREALFSILGDIEGWEVLDLFAGTGAVGLEALSRGAARAVSVESGRPALAILRENVRTLGAEDRSRIEAKDVARFVEVCTLSFDLVFADPPYAQAAQVGAELAPQMARLVRPGGRWILEQSRRDPEPEPIDGFEGPVLRTYGEARIALFERLERRPGWTTL